MLTEQELEAIKRSDIIIEGNTATWSMRVEGLVNGTYAGSFRFKCYLSPTQQIAANREYRELLGANPSFASEHESFLAYALTQLKYRIVTSPPFWASQNPAALAGDIADENVLSAVLDAAVVSELKYKAILKQKKDGAIERAKTSTKALMEAEELEDEDEDDEDEDESESQES
jgi:hypothetical protein